YFKVPEEYSGNVKHIKQKIQTEMTELEKNAKK
ncbi:unnamed protein product, partial [marine sediment metagenome]